MTLATQQAPVTTQPWVLRRKKVEESAAWHRCCLGGKACAHQKSRAAISACRGSQCICMPAVNRSDCSVVKESKS